MLTKSVVASGAMRPVKRTTDVVPVPKDSNDASYLAPFVFGTFAPYGDEVANAFERFGKEGDLLRKRGIIGREADRAPGQSVK